MKNLSQIIKEIESLKSQILLAKQKYNITNNQMIKEDLQGLIKEWNQSLRVLHWVIESENNLANQ